MKLKGVALMLVLVALIGIGGGAAKYVWESVDTPVRGAVAVKQLEDSDEAYAIQKRVAQDNVIGRVIAFTTLGGIAVVVSGFVLVNRKAFFGDN